MPRRSSPRLGRFLEWNGPSIRLSVPVPRDLLEAIGKTKWKVPLQTDSPSEAERLKVPHLQAVRDHFSALRKGTTVQALQTVQPNDPPTTPEAVLADALTWRAALQAATRSGKEEDDPALILDLIDERADRIGTRRSTEALEDQFRAIAAGTVTPISLHLDEWLNDGSARRALRPATRAEYHRAVNRLDEWLTGRGAPSTLEAVTGRIASEYRRSMTGDNLVTIAARILPLNAYWKWLKMNHLYQGDIPWTGQAPSKAAIRDARRNAGAEKRPYTPAELATLIYSADAKRLGRPYLFPMILIGALTGMRVDEIASLRAGDVRGDFLKVTDAKTAAGNRRVPIHRRLLPLVQALQSRTSGPTDYLIPGLPDRSRVTDDSPRSAPASKRFGDLRDTLGLGERPPGVRQNILDFHGLRRWFIRQARDARLGGANGFDEFTLEAVIGHEPGETPGTLANRGYAGPDRDDAARALVQAVDLPGPEVIGLPRRDVIADAVVYVTRDRRRPVTMGRDQTWKTTKRR
jgi:integrase